MQRISPGSVAHLVSRFFDYLTARPLTLSETKAIRGWLDPELAELFFEQNPADQRHAYHAALTVVGSGVTDQAVIAAALLHDVGKRHSGLGVVGRSLASILMSLGAPLGDRMTSYRDHGRIGALELAALGAPSLAIDFALHHQAGRPATIETDIWELLMVADQPPKTSALLRRRITSAAT
jgi:hypothetical protein